MDIREIGRAKEKIKKDAIDKIDELFILTEPSDFYLNSNESGFYLYCKKEILETLGFNLRGKSVKDFQKDNKKLPIKILVIGNKVIFEGGFKSG